MSKDAIVQLIWNVESFHGLILSCKIESKDDPDAAINAMFEDFVWLRNVKENKPNFTFNDLPPALPYNARIKVWQQGRRGGSTHIFTDPKFAFKMFESMLKTSGGSWEDVVVVWSDPENQPQLSGDESSCKRSPVLTNQ